MKGKEELLTFPCEFPIKVVGLFDDQFEITVLDIIRRHFPDLSETSISSRGSKDGKYLALTITVNALSKQQLDQAYIELSEHEHVIMAL